jgi:hypothetical protein
VDGDQAVELSSKTTGNFVIQMLRSAYAIVRGEVAFAWKEGHAGIYRAAGPAVALGAAGIAYAHGPAVAPFIAKNADALKQFVMTAWHNSTLVEIIDRIAHIV